MNFKNESDKEVTIIGMTLEEDTLCVEQGCLNMGYTLKNTSSYYYGNNNQYPILYKDSSTLLNGTHTLLEIPFEEHVTLAPNEEVRFDLGWQWIYSIDKQNDELDTIIGNLAGDLLNQKYSLTVSLDFYTKSNQCEIEGELP